MEEPQLTEAAPHMVRAMAPGISAALGTLLRGGQDRKSLEADRAVVEGMLQTGLTNFRYRGIATEGRYSTPGAKAWHIQSRWKGSTVTLR